MNTFKITIKEDCFDNCIMRNGKAIRLRFILIIVVLMGVSDLYAFTNHIGVFPISVPIDGGIMMGLIATGGVFAMLLKKRKNED